MMDLLEKEIDSVVKKNLNHLTNVENILYDYVEFIEKNVPSEFMENFGIGVTNSHPQFGPDYGFITNNKYGDKYYASPGDGYYIGFDFNCQVKGSDFHQMKNFLKDIPKWVENGKKELENFNYSIEKILKSLK